MNAITIVSDDRVNLIPADAGKDERSRLTMFADWLQATGRDWTTPNLAAYRDYLQSDGRVIYRQDETGALVEQPARPLSPATTAAHLSSIRGQYNKLLRQNSTRQAILDTVPTHGPNGEALDPANRLAILNEYMVRLQNEVHPTTAPVKQTTKQDTADSEHLRLKDHQQQTLMRQPGIDTMAGLRDTAMIALALCTGLREAELCDLEVTDLRQQFGGELALLVRDGKGKKQRLIPYGPLDWCLVYVDRWLAAAGITSGPVFRGFYRDNKTPRPDAMTPRSFIRLLASYPITIDGEEKTVKPHDLRRSYARNAYEHGMDLERIRQNLGHSKLETTQGYIGTLDADQRRPPAMLRPPHKLGDLSELWMIETDQAQA